MRFTKLFLSISIFICTLLLIQYVDGDNLFGNTPATFFNRVCYAAGCPAGEICGRSCQPPLAIDWGHVGCFAGVQSYCCYTPPPPPCTIISWCNACNIYRGNTCYAGNTSQYCYVGSPGGCTGAYGFYRVCGTINACFANYACIGGNCTPFYTVTVHVTDPYNGGGVSGIPVHYNATTANTNGGGTATFTRVFAGSRTATVNPLNNSYKAIIASATHTVPGTTTYNLQVTRLFTISGRVIDPNNGNAGIANVPVRVTGTNHGFSVNHTINTIANGTYTLTFPAVDLIQGTHIITITLPAGYTNTTALTQNVTVGPNKANINFGITKLFSVSGNVFIDPNINGIIDPGEVNYTATPSQLGWIYSPNILPLPNNPAYHPLPVSPLTSATGAYTITNFITGTTGISYLTVPPGYYLSSPVNGPPPTFQVRVGYGCNINGAPGAQCVPAAGGGANITNLNFGIINDTPWIQSVCGDIRNDLGVNNPEPAGQSAIITNATCPTTPGIVFSGNTDPAFGQGNASSTQQVVGGIQYPEVFNATGSNKIFSSYDYLSAKALSANLTETNLSSLPNCVNPATSCTLPAALAHGIYSSTGNVSLNGFAFPANQNYVFLIKGDLTINGNITIPTSSTVIFAVSGNIYVNPTVGSAPTITTSNLDGIYTADNSFIIQHSAGTCNDLRLNVAGTIIVNATQTGGSVQNNRNLCQFNALYPTLQVRQRPDFVLNLPEFVRIEKSVSQEVAP